jgi:hypothetical protein
MASNYSLATELHQGEVRRSERIPIRAVTGPRPVQASTREEQHSTYRKVLTRNAICDTCEKRNTTCMQKCTKCGLTSCLQCHNDGRYDSRHVLHLWSLDWTYPRGCRRANRSSRGNADNKTQPATRGSRNHTSVRERCLVREPVRPNNVGHDVAKPRERGTQSSYEQNISWNRESLVSNEWCK